MSWTCSVSIATASPGDSTLAAFKQGQPASPIALLDRPDGGADLVLGLSGGLASGRITSSGDLVTPAPFPFLATPGFSAERAVSDGTGGFLVAGRTGGGRLQVLRLQDGAIDGDFGEQGRVTLAEIAPVGVAALATGAGGRFYAAVAFGDRSRSSALFAFTADGARDLSFGDGGSAPHANGDRTLYGGVAAVDKGGRITVATPDVSARTVRVARVTPAGQVDLSFGQRGVAQIFNGEEQRLLPSLALDAADRSVVAVETYNSMTGSRSASAARLTEAGSLDARFSGGAVSVRAPRIAGYDPLGRLLLVTTIDGRLGASRVAPDGTTDCSYGVQGLATSAIETPANSTPAVGTPRSDGSLLAAAGSRDDASGTVRIVRFKGGGTGAPCPSPVAARARLPARVNLIGKRLTIAVACASPSPASLLRRRQCEGTLRLQVGSRKLTRRYRIPLRATRTVVFRLTGANLRALTGKSRLRVVINQRFPNKVKRTNLPIQRRRTGGS